MERLTAELQRCAEEAESTLEGLRMTHGRVQAQLRAERGERGVSITGYPTAVLEGAVTCSGSGLEHGLVVWGAAKRFTTFRAYWILYELYLAIFFEPKLCSSLATHMHIALHEAL